MKFDRNTVLGFVILALLFFGYFWTTSREQAANRRKNEREQFVKDSIARTRIDTSAVKKDSIKFEKEKTLANTGVFKNAADSTEHMVSLENDLIKVTLTNKGGQVKKVELKKFRGQDSSLVKLAGSDFDETSYSINTGNGANQTTSKTSDLFFPTIDSATNADGSKTISFTLSAKDSSGTSIKHEFILKKDDYMVDFNIKLTGANHLFTGGEMNLTWKYSAAQQESDIAYEKQNTQVGYVKDGSFDYHSVYKHGGTDSKNFNESVSWMGIRQRFFFAALVAKDKFASGKMEWSIQPDTSHTIVHSTANMKLSVKAGSSSVVPFSIYYGPSDYHILKKYDLKLEKIVNLGQGIYAFVRPLNRFVILPIFDFMKNLAGSLGLTIALLTIFIRLIISPLTYKSYLSGAKMKALRPEIAKLKAKHGDDRQAMSMDQMKLFREAGVNPLGGCIPALLQIPIFFALFSFFNSEVGLRGAHFLWSNDLSAYDTVIKFGANIPLLGNHLSLFNI
ncbi:MAG TPA: membrane protein insertase YidC, partial [Chitinophagaceae bacterium]